MYALLFSSACARCLAFLALIISDEYKLGNAAIPRFKYETWTFQDGPLLCNTVHANRLTTRSHMPVDSATLRLFYVCQVRNHNYLLAGAHPEAINYLCLISKRVLTFFFRLTAPRQVPICTEFFFWGTEDGTWSWPFISLQFWSYKFMHVHLSWPSGVDFNHKNNFTFSSLRMLLNVTKLLEENIKIKLVVALENLTRITQFHTAYCTKFSTLIQTVMNLPMNKIGLSTQQTLK